MFQTTNEFFFLRMDFDIFWVRALQEEPIAGRNGKTTEAPRGEAERGITHGSWVSLPRKREIKPTEIGIADMILGYPTIPYTNSYGEAIFLYKWLSSRA